MHVIMSKVTLYRRVLTRLAPEHPTCTSYRCISSCNSSSHGPRLGIDRGSLKCQVAPEAELKQAGAKQAFAPACFPKNPGAALG